MEGNAANANSINSVAKKAALNSVNGQNANPGRQNSSEPNSLVAASIVARNDAVKSLNGNSGNFQQLNSIQANPQINSGNETISAPRKEELQAPIEEHTNISDIEYIEVKNWLNSVLKDNNEFLDFLAVTPITDNIKKIILDFANEVDGVLNQKTELDYTHNDDIFMLYFLIKYGSLRPDSDNELNLQLIHIGWALSKIVIISSFRSRQYVIEDPIENSKKNNLLKIDIGDKSNPKHAFLLRETLNKMLGKKTDRSFENTVLKVYNGKILNNEEYKTSLISFFEPFPPPPSENIISKIRIDLPISGGKNKKSTNERINFNGRNRVVYVGPKGGRYIKSGGDFVRIK